MNFLNIEHLFWVRPGPKACKDEEVSVLTELKSNGRGHNAKAHNLTCGTRYMVTGGRD
jgi:hypothetical protein